MKIQYGLLALIIILLTACSGRSKSNISEFLNKKDLPSQVFSLNIDSDTVLLTKSGCIIKIPKGAISSKTNNVKLEIKEALTNTDMVLAGLTTMSGQQALSSGGMIYFNAAEGYSIEIKKQIELLVPTRNYNRDMKVYKGDSANGKIDWKDPEPLPADETTAIIDTGKSIFNRNCASCHKIFDDFTAPALYGIADRKSREWLYAYTVHDPWILNGSYKSDSVKLSDITDTVQYRYMLDHLKNSKEIDKVRLYHQCMNKKWPEMTSFHSLSRKEIDAIYVYVKSESNKRPDLEAGAGSNCCDSCIDYMAATMGLQTQREELRKDNEQFFNLERVIPIPPAAANLTGVDTNTAAPPFTKITPVSVQATYYTINIKAVGWYNIDILMKDYNNCPESELFVRLQGNYNVDVNISLIIPEYKAFVEGGKLNDGTQYGFDENNGKIHLPQNVQAYIIAFAEKDDKLIFAKKAFNTQINQTIELAFSEISKQQLKAEIIALKLDNVKAELNDAKNAGEIRAVDKKLKDAEKLKPKNCNCDFPEMAPVTTAPLENKK